MAQNRFNLISRGFMSHLGPRRCGSTRQGVVWSTLRLRLKNNALDALALVGALNGSLFALSEGLAYVYTGATANIQIVSPTKSQNIQFA